MSDATPTVIVSRRVRPGADRDFERWARRVSAAAQRYPGHLGFELQRPGTAHPDEWVIIYRFASVAELEGWLSSPERAALMAEGEALIEAPAREQRVVEPVASPDAVTAVMTQRIRPEAVDEFRRVHARITYAMQRFPGFLRSDLVEPVAGVQEEHAVVFSFASKPDLDRWLESAEREQLLRDLAPLIDGERTLNVVGGFAGWFPAADARQPVRWKQAVVVLIALYPTSLTLGFLLRTLLPQLPWVLGILISNLLGIAALTWVLMPWLTRRLDRWLRR